MKRALAVLVLGLAAVTASAQDAARGGRLFNDTRGTTGREVANCATCHASLGVLRDMLANRAVKVDDARALARWLQSVFDGAQPGAANAKAQYRGVLSPQDVHDLAAYLVQAKVALLAGD
jgi:cytochrome c553